MRRSILASLAAIILCSQCFGWGADGHRIVGAIASASLTPETAQVVRELLGEQTIADACCWADEIRNDKQYDWVKPLHYINVPRDAKTIDLKRDGMEGHQIVTAIAKYRDVLKDTSRPKAERAEALRLLLHFVGDIHQPFHVSYKEDKGGNMLAVDAFGKKSNMHRVWDSDLITRRLRDTKGGWAVMSADLRQAITAEQRKKWTATLSAEAWANESLEHTRVLYANLPQLPNDVDDAYYTRWMPTANERLQAAGVRLGALLNDTLRAEAGSRSTADEPKTSPVKGGPPAKPKAAAPSKPQGNPLGNPQGSPKGNPPGSPPANPAGSK